MNKAAFLDRDGVINVEKQYLHQIKDFEFIAGTFEALKYLNEQGYLIIIITNQSGIGRGYYTEKDFKLLTEWMIEEFRKNKIIVTDVYHCPHGPKDDCNCRKPKPGMILEAASKHNISLTDSLLVGDKESDIETAINAGVPRRYLARSGHSIEEGDTKATAVIDSLVNIIEILKREK